MDASQTLSRLREGLSPEEKTETFKLVGDSLRNEYNRLDVDVQNIIQNFVIPEFMTLKAEQETTPYAIQLFRCLCNYVADNDANRLLVFESGIVGTLSSTLKNSSPKITSLGCTLLQNLVLDNSDIANAMLQKYNDIVEILVSILLRSGFENTDLAISCLEEIGQTLNHTRTSILSLQTLARLVHRIKVSLQNGEIDNDTQAQLFYILECLSVLDDYDFSSAAYPVMVHEFFVIIDLVYGSTNMETEQKYLLCNMLFNSVGNLSGNPKNDNVSTRVVCDYELNNPYAEILAMVILGNSINSTEDRNDVIKLLSSKGIESSRLLKILEEEHPQTGLFSLQGWFLIGKLCNDEVFAESILQSKASIKRLIEGYTLLPPPVTNYYKTGLLLVVKFLQRVFSLITDASKLAELPTLVIKWAAATNSPQTKDISMSLELVIFKLIEKNATNIANNYTELLFKSDPGDSQLPLYYVQEKVKVLSMLIANKNSYVLAHSELNKVVDQLVTVSNTDDGSKNPVLVNNINFLLAKMTQHANDTENDMR
ncbi:BA75_04329T0 [Komagataella pastoris]|uniref:BA75_04329T0 n=1 Tax=Komagataella pastoris TaxID=4922 RepID=A0A1B2JF70_PICPA|nr:BA75_04329T0 [Komagataella pastoris]